MIIYKITNKNTGRCYIGQTVQKFERRMQAHCSTTSNSNKTYINKAIRKHGKDAFAFEIIEECLSLEDLNRAESFYIAFYKGLAPIGYNLHEGGDSHRVSEITRKRQSLAQKGKLWPGRGKGHIPWNKGKKGLPNNGGFKIGHPPYTQAKSTPVVCSNGKTYASISAAAKELGTSSGKICTVLTGTRSHTKGFTFKRVSNASC